MARLKLHYFDLDGGRGDPARLAMHIGGIAFEDRRIGSKEWPGIKPQMPLRALPVLEVDGKLVTQSNAINRYLGRRAGLYPQDEWSALLVDEVMDAVEDVNVLLDLTIEMEGEQKRKAREKLLGGPLALYLERFQAQLKAAGGEYFVDRRLTVADLKVFMLTRWLRSGILDHVPKDFVDRVAPQLVRHAERVGAHPKVAAYYESRRAA